MLTQPIIKHLPFYPGQWGIPGSDSALGIRTVPEGRVFYVDSGATTANDLNDGTDPNFPLVTILAAYNKCAADQNDVVAVIGQAAGYPVTALFAWDKDYTHLIGVSPDIPGVGQRVRITASDVVDLAQVMTVSADGCMFKNVQFYNGNNAVAASGGVIVTGGRNYFENCFIAGINHQNPANDAASFSLKVTGGENTFVRCSIGTSAMLRTAASAQLVFDGASCNRNKFIECEVLSWCVTAGAFLVSIKAAAVLYTLQFENCLFHNMNMTGAGIAGAVLTDAIDDSSAAFHQIVLRGKNQFVGVTGVANTLTQIWSAEPVPATGFGISVNPVA